eukprot:gene1782-4892_t
MSATENVLPSSGHPTFADEYLNGVTEDLSSTHSQSTSRGDAVQGDPAELVTSKDEFAHNTDTAYVWLRVYLCYVPPSSD